MRDFIIYSGSKEKEKPETGVRELEIEKLKKWPGSAGISELEAVGEGKLKFLQEYPSYRSFRLSCRYYPRVSKMAKEHPLLPIEFMLWQVKRSPLVIAFDAPRKVARVAVALMSMILYGDPFITVPIKLNSTDFLTLRKLVMEKSGNLTRLNLRGVRGPGGIARKFEVAGIDVEKWLDRDVDEILRSASEIHYVGFIIRPPSVERTLSFRITEWGGGQLYSPPDPLDHEILWLLDLFKQTLFPVS